MNLARGWPDINEAGLEDFVVARLQNLGYDYKHGADISLGGVAAERLTFRDAILVERLRAAAILLNPSVPTSEIDRAIDSVSRHDSHNLVRNNCSFHKLLLEGVPIQYVKGGDIVYERLRLIDFSDPESNDWLAVTQFVIKGSTETRRLDAVVFVNGLPLAMFEFKDPKNLSTTIKKAYEQIQTYKADIPDFLSFNELIVISDGFNARVGTLTADFARFMAWRTRDGETVASQSALEIEVLIEGIFAKHRFLDLVRNFIAFETDVVSSVKKLAAYHQYIAVNKAINLATLAVLDPNNRRIGVVWHTQGSGKSLSMVFFAGKIVQQRKMENPTLVVITDRNDLDGQLFDGFSKCVDLLRQKPVQAESRTSLRRLLSVGSGGIIFTTIQKFFPDAKGDPHPLLSDRQNVIVIADEAHRSQYDFIDGFARHLHDALPNASFIGFTGTPIELADKNTRAVFGDYIDTYDIKRAVEDKATVPIYYEGRLLRLNVSEDSRRHLDVDFNEVTEGQEEDEKAKAKSRWARLEAIVGTPTRLDEIASDIVQHFEERLATLDGKAMIVAMSRRICVELYAAIIKLRPGWEALEDEKGSIKVVMTGSAADGPQWQQHIRSKRQRQLIEKRFKDADDPLRLVIVRDMWLTGFDVPSMHTMYIDKPMKGHSLMQAIARVNRVFKDKPGGLVVDYLGLAEDLKAALAVYTQSGGRGAPVLDEDKAVALLQEKYEIVCNIVHNFDAHVPRSDEVHPLARAVLAADFVLGLDNGKRRFMGAVSALSRAYALVPTSDFAKSINDDVRFFQTVYAKIAKTTPSDGEPTEDIDAAIRQLISRAIASEGIIDILSEAGLQRPDIAILSDSFLEEIRNLPLRNLAREALERLLRDEITKRATVNAVQARKFSEMLDAAIKKYHNRSIETVQVINALIELAKEIRDSQSRGEHLGLTDEEVAFYDALSENESAVEVLGQEHLCIIARELVKAVRQNISIDWTLRESARAKIRVIIKRILRKYGYPPDRQERATQNVLEQSELLCKYVAPS